MPGFGRAAPEPPYLPQHGGAIQLPWLEINTSPSPEEQVLGGCLAPFSL